MDLGAVCQDGWRQARFSHPEQTNHRDAEERSLAWDASDTKPRARHCAQVAQPYGLGNRCSFGGT